jgi:hypothetical protein
VNFGAFSHLVLPENPSLGTHTAHENDPPYTGLRVWIGTFGARPLRLGEATHPCAVKLLG